MVMSELVEVRNQVGINADVWTVLKNSMIDTVPQITQHLDTFNSSSRLYDMGVSSVEIYEVVGSVEDTLDILVPTDQLSRIKTLGELGALIQDLVESKK
jgi:acyl carrier protein